MLIVEKQRKRHWACLADIYISFETQRVKNFPKD